jgi:hypothetical protein
MAVCINAAADTPCATFDKICNDRDTCSLQLSGHGQCRAGTGTCLTTVSTAPLEGFNEPVVFQYAGGASSCSLNDKSASTRSAARRRVGAALEKDLRAALARAQGGDAAVNARLRRLAISPQFCTPLGDKPDDGYGMLAYVNIEAVPDFEEKVHLALTQPTTPWTNGAQALCGGASCIKGAILGSASAPEGGQAPVVAAAATADGTTIVATADSTPASLINDLQVHLGTGFDVLNYNPPSGFSATEINSLSYSAWFRGKIFDTKSIAAACAEGTGVCFDQANYCMENQAVKIATSSKERQSAIAASIGISGAYSGFAGAASAAFTKSQNELENSQSVAVTISADCLVRTFKLPEEKAFNPYFIDAVRSVLQTMVALRAAPTSQAAKEDVGFALEVLYSKYGTHYAETVRFGGMTRLEMLLKVDSLISSYGSASAMNLALSTALYDLSANAGGGSNSSSTNSLFKAASAYSYLTIPGMPRVPLIPAGTNSMYKVDTGAWVTKLLDAGTSPRVLYPTVDSVRPLSILFKAAAVPNSLTYKAFQIEDALMVEMRTLAIAFDAYMTNDVDAWVTTGLPMPQLQTFSNWSRNGRCARSPYLVTVKQKNAKGETSIKCLTCLRGVATLPTDFEVSKANPNTTELCTINAEGDFASIGAKCKPCGACKGNLLCASDDSGFYKKAATCDDCMQCDETNVKQKCYFNNNGRNPGGAFGGFGAGGKANEFFTRCIDNRCQQCGNSKDCGALALCFKSSRSASATYCCNALLCGPHLAD